MLSKMIPVHWDNVCQKGILSWSAISVGSVISQNVYIGQYIDIGIYNTGVSAEISVKVPQIVVVYQKKKKRARKGSSKRKYIVSHLNTAGQSWPEVAVNVGMSFF